MHGLTSSTCIIVMLIFFFIQVGVREEYQDYTEPMIFRIGIANLEKKITVIHEFKSGNFFLCK
jgi:hypothetical protein